MKPTFIKVILQIADDSTGCWNDESIVLKNRNITLGIQLQKPFGKLFLIFHLEWSELYVFLVQNEEDLEKTAQRWLSTRIKTGKQVNRPHFDIDQIDEKKTQLCRKCRANVASRLHKCRSVVCVFDSIN